MAELYRPKQIAVLEAADTATEDRIDNEIVPDIGQVGDVVQSMLTEAQFQAIRGTGWVLMDGRSVAGSQYQAITGNGNIPDARGVFLRGKNNGSSANPDGDLPLGTYTGDAIRNISGAFRILNTLTNPYPLATGPFTASGPNSTIRPSPGTGTSIPDQMNFNAANQVPTAADNRPKNITVNTFIKIN